MVHSNFDLWQWNIKQTVTSRLFWEYRFNHLPGSAGTGEPFARRATLPKKRLAEVFCCFPFPSGRISTKQEQTWGQFCTRTTHFLCSRSAVITPKLASKVLNSNVPPTCSHRHFFFNCCRLSCSWLLCVAAYLLPYSPAVKQDFAESELLRVFNDCSPESVSLPRCCWAGI